MKKIKYKYSRVHCQSRTPCPYDEKVKSVITGDKRKIVINGVLVGIGDIRYVGATSCEECEYFIKDHRVGGKNKYIECNKE